MRNFRCCTLTLALVFAVSLAANGQALPTAMQGGMLQVGLGVSTSKTDLMDVGNKNISGITIYGSYDLVHLGLEADLHFTNLNTPADFGENSYLLGPRYVFRLGRFEPYIKVQAGIGQVKIDAPYIHIFGAPGSYFDYAFGGGLNVRFRHHIHVRADLDYQNYTGWKPNALTPYVATVGVAYGFR